MTIIFENYLAGFFDGDGCINIEKCNKNYILRIRFAQSNKNLLEQIQIKYPILHLNTYKQRSLNYRIQYELRASGIKIKSLLDDLSRYSILKHDQLLIAIEFLKLYNLRDKNKERHELYLKLRELKKSSKDKMYNRLNILYIAGFFDAEGSIGFYNNSLRLKITQKNDITILYKIRDLYNNTNNIDNYAISFYGINCEKIINDIIPYCIYKKDQLYAGYEILKTLNKPLTTDILNIRNNMNDILKKSKHI